MIADFPYNDIPKEYRLGIVPNPRSNYYVSRCPECEYDMWKNDAFLFALRGFYDWNGMAVPAYECPKCFAHWWNHADKGAIGTNLRRLDFITKKQHV